MECTHCSSYSRTVFSLLHMRATMYYYISSALTIWGNFPRFFCFYGGGIRHNEDIMHSFQNFIVRLIPNLPPPLETRTWKLVVRALYISLLIRIIYRTMIYGLFISKCPFQTFLLIEFCSIH